MPFLSAFLIISKEMFELPEDIGARPKRARASGQVKLIGTLPQFVIVYVELAKRGRHQKAEYAVKGIIRLKSVTAVATVIEEQRLPWRDPAFIRLLDGNGFDEWSWSHFRPFDRGLSNFGSGSFKGPGNIVCKLSADAIRDMFPLWKIAGNTTELIIALGDTVGNPTMLKLPVKIVDALFQRDPKPLILPKAYTALCGLKPQPPAPPTLAPRPGRVVAGSDDEAEDNGGLASPVDPPSGIPDSPSANERVE